ncbi:hypothetical protein HK100_009439, partial [Physocladia obscura]
MEDLMSYEYFDSQSTTADTTEYFQGDAALDKRRNIFFALEHTTNLLSAIKCTFDHLSLFPMDQFTVVAIVQTQSEREITIAKTITLLRSLYRSLPQKSSLLVKILVAPSAEIPIIVCKLVNHAKANLLILGLHADSYLG